MSYTSLKTKGERVYVKHSGRNNPYQITVHWEECSFGRRAWSKPFIPEDWPKDSTYYIIACNHCKPTLI